MLLHVTKANSTPVPGLNYTKARSRQDVIKDTSVSIAGASGSGDTLIDQR